MVRVIAYFVDGAALRVGGDERHRGASALKRERQLVGEGVLPTPPFWLRNRIVNIYISPFSS